MSANLLEIKDLDVRFRIDRKSEPFRAVKGISFDIPEHSTVALVGESGSGKSVSAMAILGLLPENAIVGAAEPHPLRRARPAARIPGRAAGHPRQGHLGDLPGADDVAEPGVHRRRADRGGAAHAPGHGDAPGAGARGRAAGRGRHPEPAAAHEFLPPRDVRRPAAARDDRHGDRLRAQAPDRRRAHHRARRDDPEADPRPHRRAAGEAPHVGALHHPRPGRGGRDRRPRGGDAGRRDPRAGRR